MEVYQKLTKAGLEWSKLKQIASVLEESQRVEMNTLICKYLDQGMGTGVANIRGRAESDLVDYNIKMTEAMRDADDAKVKYDAAKAWFEAIKIKSYTTKGGGKDPLSLPPVT